MKFLSLLLILCFTTLLAGNIILTPLPSPSATVTPATQGTLQFWAAFQKSNTITLSGANVTAVTDSSASGINMTGLASHLPTYSASGGGPGGTAAHVDFNQQSLTMTGNILPSSSASGQIFVVFKFNSHASGADAFLGTTMTGVATNSVIQFQNSNGKMQFVSPSGTVYFTMTADTSWHVLEMQYNGSGLTTAGNWTMYLDNVSQTLSTQTGGHGTGTAVGTDTNGAIDTNWYINASIGEIFSYGTLVTGSPRTNLYQNYFNSTYGFTF